MSDPSNSRWNNLKEFQKKLKVNKYEEQKGINEEYQNNPDKVLKIHTNIDEDYEIHPSENSSVIEVNKVEDSREAKTSNEKEVNTESDVESNGTVIVYDEPEGYSNPIAELGYDPHTHASDSNEYMEEVIEVNESDTVSEPELSMKEK